MSRDDLSRTYGELQRHLHQMTVLHEVNTRLAAVLEPDVVVDSVLDSLSQFLRYQLAALYLVEADPTSTSVQPPAPQFRAGRTFAGAALPIASGTPAAPGSAVRRAVDEVRTVGGTHAGMLSLVVPLRAGGRVLGALEIQTSLSVGEDEVRIVELLASSTAVALENATRYQEIQQLATTDALTGLSNYRHFHEQLTLEVQRARRMAYPLGLLSVDIDHFKQVNDAHGHPIGDQTLRLVAGLLRARLRRTDVLGRVGGEEFGVLLPGASLAEVAVVGEKLRRAMVDLPPLPSGRQVTVSVGGTSLGADRVDGPVLIAYADQALYQAKRLGRNQVQLWTDPLPPRPRRVAPPERRSA